MMLLCAYAPSRCTAQCGRHPSDAQPFGYQGSVRLDEADRTIADAFARSATASAAPLRTIAYEMCGHSQTPADGATLWGGGTCGYAPSWPDVSRRHARRRRASFLAERGPTAEAGASYLAQARPIVDALARR